MNLQGLAAALREVASRAEAGMALEVVQEMVKVYMPVLEDKTPVLTGKLRRSERPDFIGGGGRSARAVAGPHTVYAAFRNDGGTITAKRFPQLGNPEVGFFGKSVTQSGSHYMERAHDAAEASCDAAAQLIADGYFEDAGL